MFTDFRKLLNIVLAVSLVVSIVGCGMETTSEVQPEKHMETARAENNFNEVEREAEDQEGEFVKAETETHIGVSEESLDFSFADMAGRSYAFASGAGGWSEDFTIEKDGFFTGYYHDSDMGDAGEDYEDGTVYSSTYTGYFTNLTKVNAYTYTMELADISYKDEVGSTRLCDNIRYIYTDSYCLGDTDIFTVYLPGTPVSELPEEICMWLSAHTQLGERLDMIAIVDEKNMYGIASYDRPEPLEDACMMYDNCKAAYDSYGEKASKANSTVEMVEYSSAMYEISDECLNYIWNLIRYNTEETRYHEILEEQRAWISQKETRGEEVKEEYQMGTLGSVIYNDELASLTMERCQKLIEYLEE